ncbi:hypothetical protein C820_000256 [Clostridium sp. MD294]|nr:hypothetical protein C820_000256 [Clostridium sp. MD294]
MDLEGIPPFDVKKHWEEFQRDYLLKVEKLLEKQSEE